MKLLDAVALKEDCLEHDLVAGQVGTLVNELAPEVYLVEFSNDKGQTYAMPVLKSSHLLALNAKVA